MGLCPTKSSILLFSPGKVDRFLAANISRFILRGWVLVNLRWQILDIIGYVRDINVVFCIEGRRHIRADFSSDWLTECWPCLAEVDRPTQLICIWTSSFINIIQTQKTDRQKVAPSSTQIEVQQNTHLSIQMFMHTHFHIYSILSTNNMWYVCM